MLFNSLSYLLFFPLVVVLYYIMAHRYRWALLLAASSVFYMAFVPAYILILYGTILLDYVIGIQLEQAKGRRRNYLLYLSIIANIGVLAVFKYFNFFTTNFNAMFEAMGLHFSLPVLNILVPLGLSFHTFQALSYTIEIYRGQQKAERHLGIYALYVLFFPQLVAGPIERPQNMLHQYREKKSFNPTMTLSGLRLILWGYFKKVVIADRIAMFVDTVYQNYSEMNQVYLILAALAFVIQIYGDFSGYSDIAIGSARILGINLMVNFDRPLFSKNITEFWRRWHISLSTWFKDYIYQPLAFHWRNAGIHGVASALLITFIASGLWHGAGWNFFIYGLLYGAVLCFELYTKNQRKIVRKRLPVWLYSSLSIGLTFMVVSFIQIFFRATSLEEAVSFISHMIQNSDQHIVPYINEGALSFGLYGYIIVIATSMIMFFLEHKYDFNFTSLDTRFKTDIAVSSIILFLIITLGVFNQKSFIYFQF